jgi:hypothetical protein
LVSIVAIAAVIALCAPSLSLLYDLFVVDTRLVVLVDARILLKDKGRIEGNVNKCEGWDLLAVLFD